MKEIKYVQKGRGNNCLFLIHGFCSGPEDWDEQLNFFKGDLTIIIPTLRGHDNKNINNRPMSIEQLSNDCVNILKTKPFNKIVIAGHSMGTRLAIDLANKIKNVCGLILVDGSKFGNFETYFNSISEFENLVSQNDYKSILTNMFSSMFFSNVYNEHKIRIIKRAIEIPKMYSLPLRRNTIWYDSHCVENNLKNLNLPLLVLQSTKIDEIKSRTCIKKNEPNSYVQFVENCSEKVKVNLFENTGHYITIEKPQVVNQIIKDWLIDLKVHFREQHS